MMASAQSPGTFTMRAKNDHNREGLFKSIVLAHTILILHVLLLAGVGLLVLFFGGLVRYLVWIVLTGFLLAALGGYLFYRRLRREGRTLRDALHSPTFQGRAVEISFLGGIASFRLGPPTRPPLLDAGGRDEMLQLEDPQANQLRDIEILARLLEKKLITPEEYTTAKRRFFGE
ncbi:MAG: SHOCT domain-containing protein [Desulfobacteraceae bacterium]|nr:MAG: SHOCT domain-containing protein [Desulfobacteraceae bacterium]